MANDANGDASLNDEMVKYGKGVKLRDGEDVAVLTIGSIGNTMVEAIEELKIQNSKLKIEYGKGVKLRDGKDIAVLTIGSIGNPMSEAISQLSTLNSQLSIAHYDMRWLKPLDEEILHEVGKHFKTIVTAEDGIIAGGLGSAVLEWMSDHGYTPHVIRLGVNDQFVEHGSTKELYHMLKLDKEGLLCELLSLVQAK